MARKRRAVFGLLLANSLAGVLVLATIGLLTKAQPAAAQGAAHSRSLPMTNPRLAPADNSVSMSQQVQTGSGDNSVVFNGDWVTYTISITNNSTGFSADNINVFDTLPADTLDKITCLTPCEPFIEVHSIPEPLGGTVLVTVTTGLSWTVGTLPPSGHTQLTFAGRVLGQSDGIVFKNSVSALDLAINGVHGNASTPDLAITVRAKIDENGQASLATAPTWFSSDLGGTLSQDWGDFNSDGYLDLVLGSSVGTSVYRNEGGRLKAFWSNTRRTYGVRWADVNHDGKLDIVAVGDSVDGSAVTSGTNYLYTQGVGEFDDLSNFQSDFQMVRVAVGDFTGDNAIDIIASTNTINANCPVQLFTNNGAGVFSGPSKCLSQTATAALGPVDYNNDSKLDLAVGVFPNSIVILKNDGAGNFTGINSPDSVVVDSALPFLPYDFAWGDYDGNGFLDLAAAFPLQKEARIYRNLGAGVFDSPLEPFRTTKFLSPLSVDWGDFNGDGQLDLAVADEAPKIYLNSIGTFDQSNPLQAETVPGQVWSARAATVDLSGNLNLALTNRDAPSLMFNGFAPHLATGLTPVDSKPASSLAWGDANSDGTLDLLLGAGPLPALNTLLYFNTAGAFTAQPTLSSGLGPQSVAFGDVNGDGKLDIAVGNAVDNRLFLAGHTLAAWTASAPNFPAHIVAFGDANSDGKLDLLVGANGGGVAVYLNTGTTLAASPVFTTPETGNVRAIAWADYDQDQYMDFAVAFYNQPTRIYHNNKNNTFTSAWNSANSLPTTSVAWADFNHDGFPDLAVGTFEQGTRIYENLNGTFPANHQAVWTSPTLYRTTSLAWGDWDADGYPDLAIGNDSQPTQVFGNFASSPGLPRLFWIWSSNATYLTTGVAWGDYDGDGDLDLGLSQKGASGFNGFYKNGNITPSHLDNNFVPTLALPNNPSYLAIDRPGQTANAYLYSASEIVGGSTQPTVTVVYTLYDPDGSRRSADLNAAGNTIAKTYFEFSLDGGSTWKTASPAVGWTGPVSTTTRLGQSASFTWDIVKDQAISDDARFRIRIVPAVAGGPVQRASTTSVSPPFRVRGVTCDWAVNPSILMSPNPLPKNTLGTFVGSVSAGTGQLTYAWDFGDGTPVVLGQVAHHAYTGDGAYAVTLTVSGVPCPKNRDVVTTATLAVGTGQAPKKLYLPLLLDANGTSAASQGSAGDTPASEPPAANAPTQAPSDSGGQLGGLKVQALPAELPPQLAAGTRPAEPLALPVQLAASTGNQSLQSPSAGIIPTQITTLSIGINNEPSLSGDGTRIAFWSTADLTGSNPDGNIEVFLLQTNTGGMTVTQVSNSTGSILGGFNLSPSLDDAGSSLAFFSDRDLTGGNPDTNFEIFRYNVATAVLTQVTHTEKGFNILPSSSGNGQFIAFASDRDFVGTNPDGNTEIFRAEILPGNAISYTQVTSTTGGVNDEPGINADGTRITFISNQNLDPVDPANGDNNREVFLASLGAGGQVTFTQISRTILGNISTPSIDGAGTRIAFVSNRAPGSGADNPFNLREVYYADVGPGNTLSITRVTSSTSELGNDQPSISADGTRIGFVSPNIGQVRIYDTIAGGEITATIGASLNPSLSADGTILVFAFNRQLYLTSYPLANVQVIKSGPAGSVFQNNSVTYTVVVHNGGPSPASNVLLTDTLGIVDRSAFNGGRLLKSLSLTPALAGTCVSNQPSISQPITCTLGTLAANATVTLTVAVTPTAYGDLSNVAAASTDTYERVPTTPSSIILPVKPLPVGAVDLALAGPPTGTANIGSLFMANVSPITASVPLTYFWQISDHPDLIYTSTLFSESQIVTWNPGGVQTVTVYVSNAANNVVSATRTITIFNPSPVLSTVVPNTATLFDPDKPIVLTGAGFVLTSKVLWNGVQLAAGFVTSTSLTATVPAANLTTAGIYAITVFNDVPGGGLSAPLTFTVNYPAPHITNTVPVTAATGGVTLPLTINGSNFFNGASLYWDGKPPLSTTVSGGGSLLTVTIPFSYLLTSGAQAITVTNPAPNAGASNSVNFNVINPTLTLSVNPGTIGISQTATLTATISDVQAGARTITLTSSNPASAAVPTTVILPAQTAAVAVTVQAGAIGANVVITGQLPASIGGDTDSVPLVVNYRKPTIGTATPVTTTAGGLTFTLTLAGSDFVSGAQIYWGGQPLATTWVSGSSLTATVPASLFPTPGSVAITVTNPLPNAGSSDPLNYTVVSPTITLTPSNLTIDTRTSAVMTVTISAPQAANRLITLATSIPGLITLPANVVLPALSSSVSFTVTSQLIGGTGTITATLPAAQGGQSDTSQVTVNNPSPGITDVTPNPVLVSLPASLIVTGSGYVSTTLVLWNDVLLTDTQINSDTQLTATVPGSLIPISGAYTLTVSNTVPVSGAQLVTWTVQAVNPQPIVTSMAPISATAGDSSFQLHVFGSQFINGVSSIYWNGGSRVTTFIGSGHLRALITAALVAQPNEYTVTVGNSLPGGGFATKVLTFTVLTSQPNISTISPTNALVGSAPFTLVVTGTGFVTSSDPNRVSVVQWNGTALPTTYVSGTKLTAIVDPSVNATDSGTYTVTVLNADPSPLGGDLVSGPAFFSMSNYVPQLDSINPTFATAGDSSLTLTLTGLHFVRSTSARWNGVTNLTTFYVSPTSVTATVPTSLLTTVGFFSVTVSNPAPGGGTSAPQVFTVNNKAPHLNQMFPISLPLQSSALNVTVTGTQFVNGALIVWDGNQIAGTNFVNSTKLTASVPASNFPVAGIYSVTVLNPAPPAGGIESPETITVTLNNPKPVITSRAPVSQTAGTGAVTVTLGSSTNTFEANAVGYVNGSARVTTFVSTGSIQVALTAADINTVGTLTLTAQNPDPSYGMSNAALFTVVTPTVTLAPANPPAITLPTPSALLTATISGPPFQVAGTVISLTSSNPGVLSVPATVILPASTASISFSVTTHNVSGTATITATLPANLGGDVSNGVTVQVLDQAISGLAANNDSPTPLGSSTTFTATYLTGTGVTFAWNFGDGSSAPFSASPTVTHTATAGNYYTAVVTATNSIGALITATTVYTVNNPQPIITSILPTTTVTSNTSQHFFINGGNFVPGAKVEIRLSTGGTLFTYTTFNLTSTSLEVNILGSSIPTPGAYNLWVINPEPPVADTNRRSLPKTLTVQ